MAEAISGADVFVIVTVRHQNFAFPAACVQEILTLPEITPVHTSQPALRGVINLRGKILPLVDLRVKFGWRSVPAELAEFCGIMAQRESDHQKWLDALERSIADRVPFSLATDPHQCAFGRWYYAYRADSPWIAALLSKFEAPHQAIHAIAEVTIRMVEAGQADRARELIARKRSGELATLHRLFGELKELVRDSVHELAVVINHPAGMFALTVDQAVAAERIGQDRIRGLPPGLATHIDGTTLHGVAERNSGKDLAIIVEPGALASRVH